MGEKRRAIQCSTVSVTLPTFHIQSFNVEGCPRKHMDLSLNIGSPFWKTEDRTRGSLNALQVEESSTPTNPSTRRTRVGHWNRRVVELCRPFLRFDSQVLITFLRNIPLTALVFEIITLCIRVDVGGEPRDACLLRFIRRRGWAVWKTSRCSCAY